MWDNFDDCISTSECSSWTGCSLPGTGSDQSPLSHLCCTFLAETKGLPLDEISSMEVVNVRKNVKEFSRFLGWLLRGGFVQRIEVPLSHHSAC